MRFKKVTTAVFTAFLLGGLIPGSALAMSRADAPEEVYHPRIVEATGPVLVRAQDSVGWEVAEAGMLLLGGDTLKTGEGGYVRVQFRSGKLELYENTVILVPSVEVRYRERDIREVDVDEGEALFDINPMGVSNGFRFRTKNVQGGVKGTLFTVSYVDGGTAVNVYRGVVEVSGLDGEGDSPVSLTRGKAVRVVGGAGFGKVRDFDPSPALKDYEHNIPPGLEKKTGLPADYRADPRNRGVRKRGSDVSGNSGDTNTIVDGNDQGEDQQ